MKTIIAGTDFSPRAAAAVRYAAALARETGAELILYHAVVLAGAHHAAVESHGKAIEDFLVNQAQTNAVTHVASLRRSCGADFNPTIVIETADYQSGGIMSAAAKRHADVIVVGTRGSGTISRRVLGSVASRLLDSPRGVPVIAVPRHARYHGLKTIVLSSSLDQIGPESRWLADFLKPLHPELHVLHLTKGAQGGGEARTAATLAAVKASGWDHAVFAEPQGTDWVDVVDDYVADVMADLLCIVPRPHTLWEDLFGKRLITELAFESIVPLLSLPAPAAS